MCEGEYHTEAPPRPAAIYNSVPLFASQKKADQVDSNKAEEQVKFKRLAVLEFTSDRKRMSTIVQDQTGQVWLYTKGAESHVLPLCTKTNKQFIATTQQHINEFAKEGLRTLAVARKKLTTAEYNHFNNGMHSNGFLILQHCMLIPIYILQKSSRLTIL